MAAKTQKRGKRKGLSNLVNVDPKILDRVRKRKEKTGQEIGKFYDIAVVEKLEREEAMEKKMKELS